MERVERGVVEIDTQLMRRGSLLELLVVAITRVVRLATLGSLFN